MIINHIFCDILVLKRWSSYDIQGISLSIKACGNWKTVLPFYNDCDKWHKKPMNEIVTYGYWNSTQYLDLIYIFIMYELAICKHVSNELFHYSKWQKYHWPYSTFIFLYAWTYLKNGLEFLTCLQDMGSNITQQRGGVRLWHRMKQLSNISCSVES